MDFVTIITAIGSIVVSVLGTLGVQKFIRTKDEKVQSKINNDTLAIDMMAKVVDSTQKQLDKANDTIDQLNVSIMKLQNQILQKDDTIVTYSLENKDLAVKVTKLELCYCDIKDCLKRNNPYINCQGCPEADTCAIKDMKRNAYNIDNEK